MTLEQKRELKEKIEQDIAKLQIEIKEIKAKVYPSKEQDRCDKSAHLTQKLDQSVHFKRLEEATKRLNRLNSAILKVDTKDYGICKECEEPIALERLKLVPESIYCIECINEFGLI